MTLVPPRFLVRILYSCRSVAAMPRLDEDQILDLPESCRLESYAALDGLKPFADVRVAWNQAGLGVQLEVRGKSEPPKGDATRPRGSDGLTLWLDTRDARITHRATRYCHQFHFLPAGAGPERDEPVCSQTPINRALHDAPLVQTGAFPFRSERLRGGYRLEAFLPAAALHGFDPDQNPRLGICYAVRDAEYGEQILGVGSEFPYWEDPSLWSVLELARPEGSVK